MTLPIYPNTISIDALRTEFNVTGEKSLGSFYAGAGIVSSGTQGFPLGVSTNIPSTGNSISLGNFHGASALPYNYSYKISASASYRSPYFISYSGDRIIGQTVYNGANKIFVRSGDSWSEEGSLLVSDEDGTNRVLANSALLSSDGSVAVVVEPSESLSPTYVNNGAAHVFTRSGSTWTYVQKLRPSQPYSQGYFSGGGVTASSNGNTLIFGSPAEKSGPTWYGRVTIFTKSGSSWAQENTITGPSVEASFGGTVATDHAGTTLVVGNKKYYNTSTGITDGRIYIYTKSGTAWTNIAMWTPTYHPTDFGISNTYSRPFMNATNYGEGGVGQSVAISGDGNTIAAGAMGNYGVAGWVFIFRKINNQWTYITSFTGDAAGDEFGWYVSLSYDGNILVTSTPAVDVPAILVGAMYIYKRDTSTGTWSFVRKHQRPELLVQNSWFGSPSAITPDANYIFSSVGYYTQTGIYVYKV